MFFCIVFCFMLWTELTVTLCLLLTGLSHRRSASLVISVFTSDRSWSMCSVLHISCFTWKQSDSCCTKGEFPCAEQNYLVSLFLQSSKIQTYFLIFEHCKRKRNTETLWHYYLVKSLLCTVSVFERLFIFPSCTSWSSKRWYLYLQAFP